MELFQAHEQWKKRPNDERFETLEELHAECLRYAEESGEKKVPFSDLRVEKVHDDVQLMGKSGVPARLTHWAFGQLCRTVGAPADYLRQLPATLACQNLNYGLTERMRSTTNRELANLMFHENGGLLLRSIMTDAYARIWNWEITERLLDLKARGWEPAKPDKRFDGGDPAKCQVCDGSGQILSTDGPLECCPQCKGTGRAFPALYASDHDMFAMLRNSNLTVAEKGSDFAMYKGVIVQNSEVGASSLKLTRFLYREMCGNHIVWGASKVLDLSVRHVGNARARWAGYYAEVKKYADEGTGQLEQKIAASQSRIIAGTKPEVLDAIFGKRINGLTKANIEGGYDAVRPDQDGNPNSVWGFVQGLTRFSQTLKFADARAELDRAAGKLIDAF